MEARQVQYQVQGAAAVLTIDRPKQRNALSGQVLRELEEGVVQAERDPAVRAVVITGSGEKIFSAGGDLSGMGGEGGFLGSHDGRRSYGLFLQRLQASAKPTVARVNGHALAGGVGLVLACDLAVMAEDAELGTPEIDVGLFPMQVLALLQRHLGRKRSLELLLLGERISAAHALEFGLVNRVVPRAALDAAVAALTGKLSEKSLAVLALGRRAFFAAEDLPLPSAFEHLASQLSLNICAEDAAEGVTAFLEKRKARWHDR